MSFSTIDVAQYPGHLDALRALASTPGLQREKAMGVLKAMAATEFAYSVSFGKAVARITGSGAVMPAPVKRDKAIAATSEEVVIGLSTPVLSFEDAATLTGMSERFDTVVTPGAAPANKVGPNGLIVPAGLCLLVAAGGVGKSPLAHMLAGFGVSKYGIVRAGEPLSGYTSNRERVAQGLASAMYHHSDVVLDSIKDLLSSSSGGAMKGGISREALLDLSSWASTAASLGVTLYVPLNPSSRDLIDGMIEVAASNATVVVSNAGSGATWSWSSRTGEGLPRVVSSIEFAEKKQATPASSATAGGLTMRADLTKSNDLRGIVARTQSRV